MKKMTVWFDEDDLMALNQLAQEQLRSPQEQARWMLREQLRERLQEGVTFVTINDERREVE